MLIIHHNDLDGRCAAAVIYRKVRPEFRRLCRFAEIQYGMPVPRIEPGEGVFIVDFSFKPEDMAKIESLTQDIVWCDHHITARSYGYQYPGYCDFSEKGLSGCECAWKFIFTEPITQGVQLIGSYDSWRFDRSLKLPSGARATEEATKAFYEGCKIVLPESPSDVKWELFINGDKDVLNEVELAGKYAIAYRDNYLQLRRKNAYEVTFDGFKCLVMNVQGFGNAAFDGLADKYDACICYVFDGTKNIVSVYSDKIDASVLCKAHGGGGHKGAAGFTCAELPWIKKGSVE